MRSAEGIKRFQETWKNKDDTRANGRSNLGSPHRRAGAIGGLPSWATWPFQGFDDKTEKKTVPVNGNIAARMSSADWLHALACAEISKLKHVDGGAA